MQPRSTSKSERVLSLAEVRKMIMAAGRPEYARVAQRFFKTGRGQYGEGDIFIGIRVPDLRQLSKRCTHLTLPEITVLLASKIHEERLMALYLLIHWYEKGGVKERQAIIDLYLASTALINNWDLVDTSADKLLGRHLEARSKTVLERLAHSSQLWERRIAIVSTFWFIRRGEMAPTIRIATLLLKDQQDLIHKAVGWMLREVGKRSLVAEEAFLDEHAAMMPRTMLRYAIERFPEQRRRWYLTQGA